MVIGEWVGEIKTKESIQAILEALEHGINWIDTARTYGFGVSEEAVGKALREWKADDIIVATKCGVLPQEDNKPRRFISSSTIREEVEGSLRRLRRDWIDLYQIHWPDPLENLSESWETLQELRKEGKIRWAGVCNCWKEELELLDPDRAGYFKPTHVQYARTRYRAGGFALVRRKRNRCSCLQSYAFRSAYGKSFTPVAGWIAG